MNNGTGRVWAVNAEGGDKGRPNGVGPVYIENIDKIGGGGGGGGGSYTAGNGIEIENNQISVDTDVVATKSDLPDMSEYATESELTDGLATKQDVISDLSAIRSGAQAGTTAVQPAALNDYATTSALTSGLSAKQDVIDDLSTIRSGAALGSTAVQPAALDDYATTSALTSGLAAKQDTIADLSTIRSGAQAGSTAVQPGSLATVATSGSYNDLSNTPTIPGVDQTYNSASTNAQSGTAVAGALASYTPTASLSTVATTGEYADLLHKPTIPTVPDTKPAVAGSNVTITENANDITISATDTTYSAGTGMTLTGTTFSVDNPMPDASGASQGDVLTVGATGVEWATPSGGSGGVVMLDYEETDKNLFNAAVAGMTNGQPVFVTRSFDQTTKWPAIPLTWWRTGVDGNVTLTELCFTCVRIRDADNPADITGLFDGFSLKKTVTYDPETQHKTIRYNRKTFFSSIL